MKSLRYTHTIVRRIEDASSIGAGTVDDNDILLALSIVACNGISYCVR